MFWSVKAELNRQKKLIIFEGRESIVSSSANILCEITHPILNDANEFITRLRRFSQSKFHTTEAALMAEGLVARALRTAGYNVYSDRIDVI